MSHARTPRWYLISLIVLVVARLILISHDEVVTASHDAATYIAQAGAWYWKNTYNDWSYTRQPGYPLFLATGTLLGIPARLCIEVLWIFVALVASGVARAARMPRPFALLLFALLTFHPFATLLMRQALSENLYACTLLLMLASLAMAISRRSKRDALRWGVLAGLSAGLTAITRQETILVYLLVGLAGVLVLKAWRFNRLPRRYAVRRLALGCILPLTLALGAEHAVRAANLARIGAYVTYDWSTPGFKALYRTLLSIPPNDPNPRVPIPRDVRDKAAAASPAFATLADAMMHTPRTEAYMSVGERTTGVPGEPGSYMLWLLREGAWALHSYTFTSAREMDAYFWSVARELRAAQTQGRLEHRWTPFSFIPPDWRQLAWAIPASIPKCWLDMTEARSGGPDPVPGSNLNRARFDAVALRRTALLAEPVDGVYLHRARVDGRFAAIKGAIAAAWPFLSVLGLSLAILGSITAQFSRKVLPSAWYTWTSLLWAAFVLRLLLVATLEATGVLSNNRYMFPNAAMLVPLAILGLHALVTFAAHTRGRTTRAATPQAT